METQDVRLRTQDYDAQQTITLHTSIHTLARHERSSGIPPQLQCTASSSDSSIEASKQNGFGIEAGVCTHPSACTKQRCNVQARYMALHGVCDIGHTHRHGCTGRYSSFGSTTSKSFPGNILEEAMLTASQVIAEKLNGSALEAFWAATSYLLTSTVFQPTIASFSNVFGRRWVTTTSVILFLLGLLICGLSQNFTLLLAGRTVQGIGGGGIIVLTQLIICDLIPLRLRGQWFGIISGMYAIGSVSGPLVGGAFSEKVTWVSLSILIIYAQPTDHQRSAGSSGSTCPSPAWH